MTGLIGKANRRRSTHHRDGDIGIRGNDRCAEVRGRLRAGEARAHARPLMNQSRGGEMERVAAAAARTGRNGANAWCTARRSTSGRASRRTAATRARIRDGADSLANEASSASTPSNHETRNRAAPWCACAGRRARSHGFNRPRAPLLPLNTPLGEVVPGTAGTGCERHDVRESGSYEREQASGSVQAGAWQGKGTQAVEVCRYDAAGGERNQLGGATGAQRPSTLPSRMTTYTGSWRSRLQTMQRSKTRSRRTSAN